MVVQLCEHLLNWIVDGLELSCTETSGERFMSRTLQGGVGPCGAKHVFVFLLEALCELGPGLVNSLRYTFP